MSAGWMKDDLAAVNATMMLCLVSSGTWLIHGGRSNWLRGRRDVDCSSLPSWEVSSLYSSLCLGGDL